MGWKMPSLKTRGSARAVGGGGTLLDMRRKCVDFEEDLNNKNCIRNRVQRERASKSEQTVESPD